MRTAQKIVLTFILSSACILVYQYQLSKARFLSQNLEQTKNGALEELLLKASRKRLLGRSNTLTNTTLSTTTSVDSKESVLQTHDLNTDKSSVHTLTNKINNVREKDLHGSSNKSECTCDELSKAQNFKEKTVSSKSLSFCVYLNLNRIKFSLEQSLIF